MSSSIQLLRSNNAQERPFPGNLLDGQPAINTNAQEPGLFLKVSDGTLVKVGPVAITSDGNPPNTAAVGSAENSVGELWFDASSNPGVLKIYDGASWISAGIGGLDPTVNSNLQVLGNLSLGGNAIPTADSNFSLGSPAFRWANLYTGDISLSNEGRKNSVDGTWGNWTMQEGSDDMFLINNRTGKKFKIALEAV
jgi:hypothetical protein